MESSPLETHGAAAAGNPESTPSGNRVLTAILFAITLGIIGPILWALTAFCAMYPLTDKAAVTLIGYCQVFLIPAAGVLGLILGIVMGLQRRSAAWKRWLIGAASILLLGIVVNGGMALVFSAS